MTQRVTLCGDTQRAHACDLIQAAPDNAVMTLQTASQARTKAQNDTIAMWYADAAKHTGDDFEAVRAYCKLQMGVPILRRDDAEFREWYDKTFKPLPYHVKLQIFERMQPAVTSLMTVKQAAEYMDLVQRRFAEAGIPLRDPEAMKWERSENENHG